MPNPMASPATSLPSAPSPPGVSEGPTVSVIIPLEFHRGQAGNCLELWLSGQTHPREDFEIILACPPDFPQDQRQAIQEKLAPWDRLVEFPCPHDIALVEQGARLAKGRFFFFTESHVLPETDTLERVMQAFGDHPEWAGFSLQSVPITHNFLSEIEARFYSPVIHQGLSGHPWCKVLDQCFAVRRVPYFEAIGFQAEFGHYSEWVLAARFHVLGHRIGYLPEGKINHYYIGELHDLEEFTADFAAGHWRWFLQSANDPTRALMQEPPVYAQRFENRRPLAQALAKVAQSSPESAGVRTYWKLAGWFGIRGSLWLSRWKYWTAKVRLLWRCWRKRPSALAALIDLNDAIVAITQQKELLKLPAPEAVPLPDEGEWTPHSNQSLPVLGLFAPEQTTGQIFCWSQPAALMELDLPPGRYQLELEWLALRPDLVEPQLFLNERPVPREKQRHFKFRVRCSWHQKTDHPLRLAWTCPGFPAADDNRLLALPLARISWKPHTPGPVTESADAEAP